MNTREIAATPREDDALRAGESRRALYSDDGSQSVAGRTEGYRLKTGLFRRISRDAPFPSSQIDNGALSRRRCFIEAPPSRWLVKILLRKEPYAPYRIRHAPSLPKA